MVFFSKVFILKGYKSFPSGLVCTISCEVYRSIYVFGLNSPLEEVLGLQFSTGARVCIRLSSNDVFVNNETSTMNHINLKILITHGDFTFAGRKLM